MPSSVKETKADHARNSITSEDLREGKPRLRFPSFIGTWPFQLLKNLAERCTERNTQNNHARVLTNSAEHGIVDQRNYFDKDIANKDNLGGYFVVNKGDYVYNPRISASAPVGPISRNNIAIGVMSPLYTVFRFTDNKNKFYEYYFKTAYWHPYMRQVSSSGARHDRMSISNDAFMCLPLPAPSVKEQQKIADCLSSLDELIKAQRQKLELLKTHKKALMQQLFPQASKNNTPSAVS